MHILVAKVPSKLFEEAVTDFCKVPVYKYLVEPPCNQKPTQVFTIHRKYCMSQKARKSISVDCILKDKAEIDDPL